VIGAHRRETGEFLYDIIPVSYFQEPNFKKKLYLKKATELTNNLLDKMNLGKEETIEICSSFLFDETRPALWDQYGKDRVKMAQIIGEAQNKVELAYIDEIRNLGYEPITERDDKRAKSFFHMLRWVKNDPRNRLPYAKTGWPKLKKYLTLPQRRQIDFSQGWTRDQTQSSRQH
jgi:hypothetical protein